MSILVVDTSALGALVFGEPKAEKVAELLSEGTIIAPLLVWFELASVCLKKIKAHPGEGGFAYMKVKGMLPYVLPMAGFNISTSDTYGGQVTSLDFKMPSGKVSTVGGGYNDKVKEALTQLYT